MVLSPEILIPMSWFMGLFFVAVALLKLPDIKGFAKTFSEYDIIAKRVRLYGMAYPWIGLILGIVFITSIFNPAYDVRAAAAVTLILMIIGTAGVSNNLFIKKKKFRCACLGTLIKVPLSKFTLGEDVIMGILAAAMLVL